MKPRVVIAEADELLLSAYRAFLVAEGFEVVAVTDGLACIDVLRHQRVTVLVLDSDLPWGLGVLAAMYQEELPLPPVLLLAAQPARVAESSIPIRAYALMIKPVPPATVAHAVSTLVSSPWGEKHGEGLFTQGSSLCG